MLCYCSRLSRFPLVLLLGGAVLIAQEEATFGNSFSLPGDSIRSGKETKHSRRRIQKHLFAPPPSPSQIIRPSPSSPTLLLDATIYSRGGATSTISALKAKQKNEDDTTEVDDNDDYTWIIGLVLPLWLVYISNQWSRSSLYYLVDFSNTATAFKAMNIDVGFTEAQYGVLASLAFTSLFAVASLLAGIVTDRFNRKTLTILAATIWSLATLGTALAANYEQVLIWRIGMGLACAFVTPPAYTLIAQKVPKQNVSLASSLYGTGVALGGAFASLSILLDTNVGWRNALVVIAVYGFAAAAFAALVLPNDPKDKDEVKAESTQEVKEEASSSSILTDVQEAVSSSRVKWLFLASFLRFSSGLCIGVWSAPYFRLAFPDQQANYAVAQALITAVGGSVSGLLGGYIADSITADVKPEENSDPIGRKLWIPVVGSILAAPTWYLAVGSNNNHQSFEVAMAWLAVEYFVAECWFGPTISVLQKTVGPKIGGTSQGLFTLTGAFANVAPSILGYLYGQSTATTGGGQEELGNLLERGVCFCYLSCAFCFAMSALSRPPPNTSKEESGRVIDVKQQ